MPNSKAAARSFVALLVSYSTSADPGNREKSSCAPSFLELPGTPAEAKLAAARSGTLCRSVGTKVLTLRSSDLEHPESIAMVALLLQPTLHSCRQVAAHTRAQRPITATRPATPCCLSRQQQQPFLQRSTAQRWRCSAKVVTFSANGLHTTLWVATLTNIRDGVEQQAPATAPHCSGGCLSV